MNLIEALKGLYSQSLSDILAVINKSKYITDYNFDKNDCFIIHTGFSFSTHKGKSFELLFEVFSKQIIRQNRNPGFTLPSLLGLHYILNGKYLNSYSNL